MRLVPVFYYHYKNRSIAGFVFIFTKLVQNDEHSSEQLKFSSRRGKATFQFVIFHFQVFYLRVGEGELSVTYLPEYVLQYVLKNAQSLVELIIAVRSATINDRYICEDLLDLVRFYI